MYKKQRGFTLIEIAIVLVIIGLLLGGVLKGQELITGARVRNFIQQQDGVKAAYFGFLDRFRALPGDYAAATTNISGIAATAACNNGNGDGDGTIETANAENVLAWEHLSKAGFINGSYTCAAAQAGTNSPTNPYGQYLNLVYDANYAGVATARHNLKTGAQVPSDILGEIDRKVDDGNGIQGSFRAQIGGGVDATTTNCYDNAGVWKSTSPGSNCGGATVF
ncbi:MAG TPA: prepilin-type N-terminal cleavage/methylation domain-containing protein [Burkholderiales bacterium]|nr:prepilin-type N-terminal cleavage/methylation domain-containing protein [Burkholderiales bacterium]